MNIPKNLDGLKPDEIWCKCVETLTKRITNRLEDKATEHAINGQQFGADGWTNHEEKEILQQKTYEKAIEIVKEVGGMND